jgi:hypothetical protein
MILIVQRATKMPFALKWQMLSPATAPLAGKGLGSNTNALTLMNAKSFQKIRAPTKIQSASTLKVLSPARATLATIAPVMEKIAQT